MLKQLSCRKVGNLEGRCWGGGWGVEAGWRNGEISQTEGQRHRETTMCSEHTIWQRWSQFSILTFNETQIYYFIFLNLNLLNGDNISHRVSLKIKDNLSPANSMVLGNLFLLLLLYVQSLSRVWLSTLWTVALRVPLSMRFPRQEYWSGLPRPPPGDLPNPEIEPRSPALLADSLLSEPPGKPF